MPYGRRTFGGRVARRRRVSNRPSRGRKRSFRRSGPIRSLAPIRSKWKNPTAQGALYKFKYADQGFDLTTELGNGYINSYTFRGNGLYDPDLTGVGTQPYGYDEVCTMFGSYRVVGSKIKVFWNPTQQIYMGTLTVVPATSSSLTYDEGNDVRVMPYAKQRALTYNSGVTRNNFITSPYITTKRMYPDAAQADADFTAVIGGTPTKQWYWHISVDTSPNNAGLIIKANVEITYYAVMRKTGNLNES